MCDIFLGKRLYNQTYKIMYDIQEIFQFSSNLTSESLFRPSLSRARNLSAATKSCVTSPSHHSELYKGCQHIDPYLSTSLICTRSLVSNMLRPQHWNNFTCN